MSLPKVVPIRMVSKCIMKIVTGRTDESQVTHSEGSSYLAQQDAGATDENWMDRSSQRMSPKRNLWWKIQRIPIVLAHSCI